MRTHEREEQAAALLERVDLPGLTFFAEGGEHRTFRVPGEDLLLKVPVAPHEESGVALRVEAELLRRMAASTAIPVPRVVRTLPEVNGVLLELLSGVPEFGLDPDRQPEHARAIAGRLGAIHAELHRLDPGGFADLLDTDDYSPEQWRDETAATASAIREQLTTELAAELDAFLARPAPPASPRRRVCHHDLGLEHVLVTEASVVAGIIDWADAALADPAYDLGLLFRDLGARGLEAALAAYDADIDDGLVERAVFHGRCALVEDLAFGLEEGRPEYLETALAGWKRTFTDP